jgi:DNA-binding transcriptional ArsR family regulator
MAEKKRRPTARGKAVQREAQEAVDQNLIKALGNEVRVAILSLLNFAVDEEWSPKMLHKELGIGLSQISYHVTQLKKYGLIELTKTEPRRGANEHFYKATKRVILPEGMAAALPKSARSVALAKVLTMAEKDLKAALAAGTFDDRPDHHASWSPFQFDDLARERIHAKLDEALELAIEEEGGSLARAKKSGSDLIPTTLVMFAFTSGRKTGGASSAFRQRT